MELDFFPDSRTLIVKIDCELDHHTSESLRRRVDNEIQRVMPKMLVFDFSKVNFMDSSGIGVILGRYKNIERANGTAAMIHVKPEINRVFEISGLTKIIKQYDSVQKAIENMQGGKTNAI